MELTGTVVSSKIVPGTDQDKYPTHDELYGVGGYRTVNDTSERNNIPKQRRSIGMLVNVLNDKTYKLKNNPDEDTTSDEDWEEYQFFTKTGTSISTINDSDTLHAAGFYQKSLRKYKKDIEKFDKNAIEILNKTEIVTFKYKSDERNAIHIGIIADDSPSELTGIDNDTFDVSSTVGILIKAVQELSNEISNMKKEINYLRNKLNP